MFAQAWQNLVPRRHLVYAVLCVFLFLLAVVTALWSGHRSGVGFNNVRGDGRLYYAYLPSVVIDGDLDFENQIREHWDVGFRPKLLHDRTETGLIHNPYPVGLALTLLPAFLVGHVVAWASGGWIPLDGYSWPYQVACLFWITVLLWRALIRIDRLLTERLTVSPGAALLGLLVLVLATPCGYYAWREPFMVHIASLFWCTEVAWIVSKPSPQIRWFWPRLAFCGAMAVACRPTNVFLTPLVIYGLVRLVREEGWRRALAGLPLASVGLIPVGLQLVSWKILEGHWLFYSYRDEGFSWLHPALLQTLFSSRHGLFLWSPVLILAAIALFRKAREPLVWCWMSGALLLWYANSSWHCWWFGDAFGARAFLELAGLFGIGLALLFDALKQSPKTATAVAGFAICYNLTLMTLYVTERIPAGGYWLPW